MGGAAAPRQDGPDTLRAISATWIAAFGEGNAALRRWGSVVERGFEPIFGADNHEPRAVHDVGIDHGRGNIGVAEQLLHGPDI